MLALLIVIAIETGIIAWLLVKRKLDKQQVDGTIEITETETRRLVYFDLDADELLEHSQVRLNVKHLLEQ